MRFFRPDSILTVLLALALSLLPSPPARAAELMGLLAYNPEPSFAAGVLGRFEFGVGRIETGVLSTTATLAAREGSMRVEGQGRYWIVPLLYRYTFLEPFFSIAAGIDYAAISSASTGLRGNAGAEIGFEATQDLGENFSAILDIRYRAGLADAIAAGNEGTRLNFWLLGLGLQKRFDP